MQQSFRQSWEACQARNAQETAALGRQRSPAVCRQNCAACQARNAPSGICHCVMHSSAVQCSAEQWGAVVGRHSRDGQLPAEVALLGSGSIQQMCQVF
jgi:hypothetical protein